MSSEESTGERRRWRRLRNELRLQLQLVEETGGRSVNAIGTHLNPQGIFVQLADPPPVGTCVRVTLAAEGTDGVLTAEGDVVSRVLLDEESDTPPGCGVHLRTMGPGWTKLYRWLAEQAEPDSEVP